MQPIIETAKSKLEIKRLEAEASPNPFNSIVQPRRYGPGTGRMQAMAERLVAEEAARKAEANPIPRRRGRPPKNAAPVLPSEPIESEPIKDVQDDLVKAVPNANGWHDYVGMWNGAELYLGMISFKTVAPLTCLAFVNIVKQFGDKIRGDIVEGNASVEDARNELVARFLATDSKYLLMLDDDMIPAIGKAAFLRVLARIPASIPDEVLNRNVVERLMNTRQSLIGAAYFGRRPNGMFNCSAQQQAANAKVHLNSVIPCDWIGTGMLLIHRQVFDDIRARFPELAGQPGAPFEYFRRTPGYGEDVSFCLRAKQAGHQPYCDLGSPVYHQGTHFYGGGTL